jgi:hypothetical protein
MVISFLVALYFQFGHQALGFAPVDSSTALALGVGITTAGWITVTVLTPPDETATLQAFYDRIRPFPYGWRKAVRTQATGQDSLPAALACWFLGCVVVYSALFATGFAIYGRARLATGLAIVAVLAAVGLFRALPKVRFE